ncbi:MAG: histidine kinase [Bacteroidetes bacterium]|nr:histidine kinase [Bacteroidota bacterium]
MIGKLCQGQISQEGIVADNNAIVLDSLSHLEAQSINSGQYQSAIKIAKAIDSLKHIRMNANYDSTVAYHSKRLDLIAVEKRNKNLITTNSELELNADRIRKNILLISILLFSIALLIGMVIYQNRLQRKRHGVLLELNKANSKHKLELEKLNHQLLLQSLTAQMDPHFMFNVLSAIRFCLDQNKLDDASKYTVQLKTLFKLAGNHSQSALITLDKEIEFITQYIELENLRLRNTLHYKIIVDEAIVQPNTYIATMMLQPLIENAIWHGLAKKEGVKKLDITISATNDTLNITIADNGIGRKQSSLTNKKTGHQSKALLNLNERLNYYKTVEGKTGALNIADLTDTAGNATGTICTILIPLHPILIF